MRLEDLKTEWCEYDLSDPDGDGTYIRIVKGYFSFPRVVALAVIAALLIMTVFI